jgi:hypothetical protein
MKLFTILILTLTLTACQTQPWHGFEWEIVEAAETETEQ